MSISSIPRKTSLGAALKWMSIVLVVGLLASYTFFQARLVIAGPSLSLNTDIPVAYTERTATIEGTARNVSSITLNGRPIFTDDAGRFSEQLVLENGYTIMTLRAADRYGREVILTQPLVYTSAYQ